MKKKNMVNAKRILILCLILAMLSSTTALAADPDESSLGMNMSVAQEYGTSVTYNVETHEVVYGVDQQSMPCGEGILQNTTEENSKNVPELRGIIGTDTRVRVNNTTDSPYRNVCFVEVTYPDGKKYRGSGVLVYFNVLLTAGHVVYSREHGGFATSVEVVPGMIDYGSRPLGATVATRMTTNNAWINNKDYQWDWAIVDLKSSFSTWQLYGYYKDYNSQTNKTVTTIGYPESGETHMYCDTNTVKESGDRYMKLLCDIMDGDSGGPVIDKNTGALVGIISYGHSTIFGGNDYNFAVRINEDLYNRLKAHQSEVQ